MLTLSPKNVLNLSVKYKEQYDSSDIGIYFDDLCVGYFNSNGRLILQKIYNYEKFYAAGIELDKDGYIVIDKY